jgi:hypothetical protein
VVVVAGTSLWLARDLPRQYVERALAERLGAEVRLGRLEIVGAREFVLHDLRVGEMRSEPRLDDLRVARLNVASSPRDAAEGRFDSLAFSGVDIRLHPPTRPPEAGGPAGLRVRRLDVRDGELTVAGTDPEARFDFTAALTGVGDRLQGSISVRSDGFGFAPLIVLARPPGDDASPPELLRESGGGLEAFEMTVEVRDAGRRVDLAANSRASTLVREGRSIRVEGVTLTAAAERDDRRGVVRVDARPGLPGVASAIVQAELDAETLDLESIHAELRDVEIETFLGFVPVLPAGWMLQGTADVDVHAEAGGALTCEVKGLCPRLERSGPSGAVRAEKVAFDARGETSWPLPEDGPLMLAYEVRASSPKVSLPAETYRVTALDPELAVDGDLDLRNPVFPGALRVDLRLPGAEGSVGERSIPASLFPALVSLDGRWSLGPPASFDGLAEVATPDMGTMTAQGRASSEDGGTARLSWSWSGAELDRLAAVGDEIDAPFPESIGLVGRVRAAGDLRGPPADPAMAGTLWLDPVTVSLTPGGDSPPPQREFRNGSIEAAFSRAPGETRVELAPIRATGELVVDPMEAIALSIDAEAELDPAAGTARVKTATVEAANLSRLSLSGIWEFGDEESVVGRVDVDVDRIDLQRLRELARPWLADPAPDYAVQGTAGATLEGLVRADGGWKADGTLRLAGVGFSSDDGARVVQGPDAQWEVSVERALPHEAIAAEAHGRLGGLLLLWGVVFGDYGAATSEIELTAEIRGASWKGDLDWTLPQGVRLSGRLDSPPDRKPAALHYGLALEVPDLGAGIEHYARVPLGDSVWSLAEIEGAGALRLRLDGVVSDDLRTTAGTLEVDDLDLAGLGDDTRVDGLHLRLPLDLVWGPAAADGSRPLEGEPGSGELRFAGLSLGGVEFPPTSTTLAVHADSVGLEQPLRIPLMGGTLHLERLTLAEAARDGRHVESSVRLDRLRLRALTESLGVFPLDGELDGLLPRVRMTRTKLLVDGGGEISVFGGTIEVRDISGENLLTRFPKLTFSAAFSDIDLAEITRTFDFGMIRGIAEGEVRECELFGGVPVRFDADFETVKRKGISQKINVKAVNNIAILGTGGRVTAFDRGIHKFFDTFTYSKIGIRMTLQNDVFVLRGTERRGDRELFVKGRLPFPIDVVNVAPGSSVSFRTMLKRARNLDVSTTAKR